MRKRRLSMILLFVMGLLFIGACEKFEDPTLEVEQPQEILEDADELKKGADELKEDADKLERQSDPSS